MHSRRTFLHKLMISAGAPALLSGRALGENPPPPVNLEESDPVAMALGFKLDTTKVNARKYPRHADDQQCNGCTLYQGKPGEAIGPCLTVGRKLVPGAGWCTVFVKKS